MALAALGKALKACKENTLWQRSLLLLHELFGGASGISRRSYNFKRFGTSQVCVLLWGLHGFALKSSCASHNKLP